MPKALPMLTDPQPICCPSLEAAGDLAEDDAIALAIRLKALADPARLRLVSLLLDRLSTGAATRELAGLVNLTEPTVSHHLRTLLEAGLVTKQRDRTTVYYRAEPRALQALGGVLHITCC